MESYQRLKHMVLRVCGELPMLKIDGVKGLSELPTPEIDGVSGLW